MTVGGVDTYYDYDEKQWKSRRLGGGPIASGPVCPAPQRAAGAEKPTAACSAPEGRPARAK
ncbi:hypothetical protein ACFVWG_20560 [Kribbella sp. NPDC058245]|uniref:hypothetical protein n=1 Tax=Kribbella sp. NPDC058245 TaxID=3346399 RepID=UPI0036F0C1BD